MKKRAVKTREKKTGQPQWISDFSSCWRWYTCTNGGGVSLCCWLRHWNMSRHKQFVVGGKAVLGWVFYDKLFFIKAESSVNLDLYHKEVLSMEGTWVLSEKDGGSVGVFDECISLPKKAFMSLENMYEQEVGVCYQVLEHTCTHVYVSHISCFQVHHQGDCINGLFFKLTVPSSLLSQKITEQ